MIIIHGVSSCGEEMAPLAAALAPHGATRSPDLLGHHGRPIPERFTIRDFAGDLIAYMDREGVERDFLIGYSFGGYLALYLARHFPERVIGACALASKMVFDAETANQWMQLADPDRYRRQGRGPELTKMHAPQDWTQLIRTNRVLWEELGRDPALREEDYAAIKVPVMLVTSNRDVVSSWDEMLKLGKVIPDCHLAMFYGKAHPLSSVPVPSVAQAIAQWMQRVSAR